MITYTQKEGIKMTTTQIVELIATFLAIPVILIIILASQQHDKDRRQREGRPPKKYHSIVDQDVTTIYTINQK